MAGGNSYQKNVVPLNGGLDLVSPRFFVTPGTLQDCLNYETYSVSGYGVVDGIHRYDGAYPCYNRDWVVAVRDSGSGTFVRGNYLKNGDNYFGVAIDWDATNEVLSYLILNTQFAPNIGDTITAPDSAATLVAGIGGIKRASVYYDDMATYLAKQKDIYESARGLKPSIWPFASYEKNVIPHGLHWYRGRLFAIADNFQIEFDSGTTDILPGDNILIFGSPGAIVLSSIVTSGSASTGDAEGTIVVRFLPGFTPGIFLVGSFDIQRPNGESGTTTISNAFNMTDKQVPNSPSAGLFYGPYDDDFQTTEQINATAQHLVNFGEAWVATDMGWEIQFTTDDDTVGAAPQTVFRGAFGDEILSSTVNLDAIATSEVLDATATISTPFAGTSSTNPVSTALHTVLGDASTATFAALGTHSGPFTDIGAYAALTGFNSSLTSIPDAAIITGIEVTVTCSTGGHTTGTVDVDLRGDGFTLYPSSIKTASYAAAAANVAIILGGDGDLWGTTLTAPNLLAAVRDDTTFGVRFKLTEIIASATERMTISGLTMKVYYRTPVTGYYAHDPVTGQDLGIIIPYYHLNKGTFNPGVVQADWATGSMSIYNITPLDTTGGGGSVNSTTWTIGSGWELRTARDGGGDLIAKFSAQMQAATLPPRTLMEGQRKRFEIITANYYANSDWIAMYGVDGVGPSWQYDGYYFYNVYTALPRQEDTPTHIAYHRNYAVLGYDNGQCIVSFPGEPTNFDPLDGSTLYPFGERITGLLSLNGTALGVFCEASIHALTGDILTATDDNNAVHQIIAPYSGAIEYTVVDCGIPLFADFRGISTVDATNKYGDFENGRVSYLITPYLMERVNDRFAYQATSQRILFALPIRNKNQYRVYFADGQILTASLPTGDRGYEFTKQAYSNSATLDTMVPVAMCTGTTRSGRDLIFGTFYLLPQDETNISEPLQPEREMFIYSIDKGTRFDLAPIKHFARLNFMTVQEPNTYANARGIRFELLAQHYFNSYVAIQADYQKSTNVKQPLLINPVGKDVRILKDSEYIYHAVEGLGTTLAIEVGGEHIYPGHVLQAMLIESLALKDAQGNSPTQSLT